MAPPAWRPIALLFARSITTNGPYSRPESARQTGLCILYYTIWANPPTSKFARYLPFPDREIHATPEAKAKVEAANPRISPRQGPECLSSGLLTPWPPWRRREDQTPRASRPGPPPAPRERVTTAEKRSANKVQWLAIIKNSPRASVFIAAACVTCAETQSGEDLAQVS